MRCGVIVFITKGIPDVLPRKWQKYMLRISLYWAAFACAFKNNKGDFASHVDETTTVQLGRLPGTSLRAIIKPSVVHQQGWAGKRGITPRILRSRWDRVRCHQHYAHSRHIRRLQSIWLPRRPTSTISISTSLLPKYQNSTTFLKQQGITRMDQSANSPTCDPIEHIQAKWG